MEAPPLHPWGSVLCHMSPTLSRASRYRSGVCLVFLSDSIWGLRLVVVEVFLGITYCCVSLLEERGIWEGDVLVLELLSGFQDACVMVCLNPTGSKKSQGVLG